MAKYVCTVCGYVYEGDARSVRHRPRSSSFRKARRYGLPSM